MAGFTSGRFARFTAALFCSAVFLAGASAKNGSAKVTAVRFWSLGDVTRVAIEVSSEFEYHSEHLTNPERLFFDVRGARPDLSGRTIRTIEVDNGVVKKIRIAETQPGVTRVVLDLDQKVDYTASQLSNPERLMIELRGKERSGTPSTPPAVGAAKVTPPHTDLTPRVSDTESVAPAAAKTETRKFIPPPHVEPSSDRPQTDVAPLLSQPSTPMMAKAVKPPSVGSSMPHDTSASVRDPAVKDPGPPTLLKTDKPTESEKLGEPAKRNTNGDRSLTRVLGLKLGRVVIDPGHGGHDVGTHGPSGLLEKDVVLDISHRLGALIEERLGSEVIYTRSDDTYIGLEERTRFANDKKADLFLSIHANSSPYRTAAGTEVYYLNFTTTRTALDVAARENASSEKSIYDLKDLLQKIALKDKIDESREFAARLQTSLYTLSAKGNTAASKNRGTKRAPFVVLIGAQMPSVLAEIGFLTNSGDEALLRKPEHRQKIADALCKGIASYAETLSHFQVAQKHGE